MPTQDHYYGAITEGISVTMQIPPDLHNHRISPAGESGDLDFYIFDGIMLISTVTPKIRVPSTKYQSDQARQILVKLKNRDVYWGVEVTVENALADRLAAHKQQATAISAAIDMLRPCKGWREFHETVLLVMQTWDIPRVAMEAQQMNALSSFAACNMAPEELYDAGRRLANGEQIDASHFRELLIRSGLWFLITRRHNDMLGTVIRAVGLGGITSNTGIPLEHGRLAWIAQRLVERL